MVCGSCTATFGYEGNIPLLFSPNEWNSRRSDVTGIVKAFYEETPFPNYDDVASADSLREKAQEGIFARLLDDQIPFGARVLEVGCGTGQLTNFLGLRWKRTVLGTDVCVNSLRLAEHFRRQNEIDQVAFLQMNLFRPVFAPESFDLVICNGVLHHTSDPAGGFQSIAKLVKIGGFLIVGLYNASGRIPTDLRRLVYRVFGNRGRSAAPRGGAESSGVITKQTWFRDQYQHPHESEHTIGEVLRWFEESNFTFVNSIPKALAFEPFTSDERLFETHPSGSRLDHALVQLGMLLNGGREGGLFMMIGRRER